MLLQHTDTVLLYVVYFHQPDHRTAYLKSLCPEMPESFSGYYIFIFFRKSVVEKLMHARSPFVVYMSDTAHSTSNKEQVQHQHRLFQQCIDSNDQCITVSDIQPFFQSCDLLNISLFTNYRLYMIIYMILYNIIILTPPSLDAKNTHIMKFSKGVVVADCTKNP